MELVEFRVSASLSYLDFRGSRMNSEGIRERIRENAAELVRLNSRVKEAVKRRQESPKARLEWEKAWAEFCRRYSQLAFPGGYVGALERIKAGDPNTMEAAICFLECRPYFFRSGYMFKDILRRCRRAPLSSKQAARLKTIEERLANWKRNKSASK
jgi:hypothetical protein